MQLGRHKQERTQGSLKCFAQRLLVVALFTLSGATAQAAPMGKLMGMPAFTNLVMAIARVNRAMRDAAENPMDDFRRKNARAAVAALPAAIAGLAAEFQAGNLHNGDLPQVQALLGGFIDVNAADNYKKFLQAPNAALIPKVGAGLPAHMMNVPSQGGGGGRGSTIVYDEAAARAARPGDATVGKDPYAQSVEVVPTAQFDRAPVSEPAKIASSASGTDDSRRIDFDESVRKDLTTPTAATNGGFAPNAATAVGIIRDNGQAGQAGMVDATRDLLAVETQQRAEAGDRDPASLDKTFFDKKKTAKEDTQKYRIQPKSKYWKFGSLLHSAEALLVHDARAQGGCKDCEGGGGGGGGGDAAGVLMGVAAIIAAIAPMVVAGIQADADKQIAKTQADAQKWMTNRTAENSEKLAEMQQQTALTQAGIQAGIAQQNNQGVTDRLNLQLASLEKAREDAAKAERERQEYEAQYNERRIALAEKQADQNLALARATLSAQLTQAGLTQGTVTSNSSNGLSVTPNAAASGASLAANDQVQAGSTAQALGSLSSGSSLPTSGLGISRGITSSNSPAEPMKAMTGDQRLLASITPASASSRGVKSNSATNNKVFNVGEDADEEEVAAGKKSTKVAAKTARSAAAVRGIKGQTVSVDSRLLAALRTRPQAGVVGGSTRGLKAVAPIRGIASTKANGDLSSFLGRASQPSEGSFADYRRHQGVSAPEAAVPSARGMTSGHAAGAYNEPSVD